MSRRSSLQIACALAILLGTTRHALADRFSIRPKPSQHRKLAPELDVVRHCNSRFKGVRSNGKAIFEDTKTRAVAIQSRAVAMDSDDDNEISKKSKRLLIRYADVDNKPMQTTLVAAGLKTVEDYETGNFLVVEPLEDITKDGVEALIADESVVHAAPDYVMNVPQIVNSRSVQAAATEAVPNDPLLKNLWGMTNIGATSVWPTFNQSPKVIVAVIDTGVDYNHPDLRSNMWSKNGKFGYDFFDDDNDPMDEQNHGTHCAGTIAGAGNNGVGVVGVSWKTQIMALRFLGPDGEGNISDAVKAIDWAVANGAHVISNSWAGPDNLPALNEAISRAEAKGVLFVAAAGNTVSVGNNNDVSPYYPAACPQSNVMTVAAIDSNNNKGSFSHYGRKTVDIGAPGVAIVSTVRNNQFAQYDGTSMAAPHVAGAAALVWAKTFPNPIQDPSQMRTVRDLIYANARPVPALRGAWGETPPAKVSGGVLDISFLKNSSENPPSNNPTPVRRLVETRMVVDPAKLR